MAAEGCPVLILGDREHPEVVGMLSYGNDKTLVMAPGGELPDIEGSRLCLISQTTQMLSELQSVACKLLPKLVELKIFNTICLATTQRQNAAVELAKNSDLMIVIGGYNSSNTKALAALCKDICLTYHIESEDELEGVDVSGYSRIGITAGASTPEDTIIKVFNRIKEKSGDTISAMHIEEIPLFKEESC